MSVCVWEASYTCTIFLKKIFTLDSVTLLRCVFVLQKNNSDKAIRRPRGLLSRLRVDLLTFAGQSTYMAKLMY